MKKSDLKNGMIVELNNGNKYLVIENTLIGARGQMFLSEYNEDLILCSKYSTSPKYNIKKVYNHPLHSWGGGFNYTVDYNVKNPIWERPKIKEVTMEEIAKKFNIPVEQLRIKE